MDLPRDERVRGHGPLFPGSDPMCHRSSFVVLAWLVVATPALAQETTTGSLGGQVVDAQGLPLPGVTVTVTSSSAPRSIVTDAQGRFLVAFLTPGLYSVRAE